MAYLYEDSQSILNHLSSPFIADDQIKGESGDVEITKTNQ